MDRVEADCAVTIKFVMKTLLADGTRKERGEEEMEFIFGTERQAPTLEQTLDGARVGERFSIHIPAAEIYGEHDPDLIREIPKAGLIKQRLRPGLYYRQTKRGGLVSFKVLEVREKTVLVDLNEPMAGISVLMDLEVTHIRQASDKEIERAREAQLRKNIGCG
jgi:FKBP-type peptidyl-prolyl cis-trans isomerase 2